LKSRRLRHRGIVVAPLLTPASHQSFRAHRLSASNHFDALLVNALQRRQTIFAAGLWRNLTISLFGFTLCIGASQISAQTFLSSKLASVQYHPMHLHTGIWLGFEDPFVTNKRIGAKDRDNNQSAQSNPGHTRSRVGRDLPSQNDLKVAIFRPKSKTEGRNLIKSPTLCFSYLAVPF
jgi:hypothetical protein